MPLPTTSGKLTSKVIEVSVSAVTVTIMPELLPFA